MSSGIKNKLELIRRTSADVKDRIDDILERNDKIEIAITKIDGYSEDLYKLMKDMADTANPVLSQMGLDKEAVIHDIDEFVRILEDNQKEMYFASINLDAKYLKNRFALLNLSNWFERLNHSIDKIIEFTDVETESRELERLFNIIEATDLPKKKKDELKEEFLLALNRLNKPENH